MMGNYEGLAEVLIARGWEPATATIFLEVCQLAEMEAPDAGRLAVLIDGKDKEPKKPKKAKK